MSRFNLSSPPTPAAPNPESIARFNESADILNEMRRQLDEQTEMLRKQFKEKFTSIAKDFFGAVPAVKSVTWTQYTPYFMDGDTCVFGINDVFFASDENEDAEDYREFEDGSDFSVAAHSLNSISKLTKEDKKFCEQLNDLITKNEDFMESLFDDHVIVILRPDGIYTEEYEHD